MAKLPELSQSTKRKLKIQWDTLLDRYRLTAPDIGRYASTNDRIRRLAVSRLPDIPSGRRLDSWLLEHQRAKQESGITPSVEVAKGRFTASASEYRLLWESSGAEYETYAAQLDAIKRQVLAELASLWKARSDAASGWYETVCAPAVEQAICALVRKEISQARDVEWVRIARASTSGRINTGNPILNAIDAGGNKLSPQAQEASRLARGTAGEAMKDLQELPSQFQNAFEAVKANTELEYANRVEQFPQHQHLAELPILQLKRIQDVFFAYCAQARDACRGCHWTAVQTRQRTDAAWPVICDFYFVREHGAASDEAKLMFRHAMWRTVADDPQWRQHLSELKGLAESASIPTSGSEAAPRREPTIIVPDTGNVTSTDRRALVDAYIEEVLKTKGRQISRTDIWKSAGYKTRTEFERWERNDPNRPNKAAHENFTRILSEKPHLK